VCQVGHLPELYEDARSEKYKIPLLVVTFTKFCLHRMYNMCICIMRGCSMTCALEGDKCSALPWRKGRIAWRVPESVWTRCRTFYLLFPTIENRFVGRPARGLFTVPTELPRLHSFMMNLLLV